jgi:predicted nucleotide-binding protein
MSLPILPILTTSDDAFAIVNYLKTKALGASIAEAKRVVEKGILNPRKLAAYQVWDLVQKDGDRIKLAPIGRELARAKPEEHPGIFSKILRSISPYHSVLEMIYHQKLSEVTNVEIASFWHEHFKTYLGKATETTIKDMAVCFFRLSEGASLGQLIVGRKGQATRFTVAFDQLTQYIAEGALVGGDKVIAGTTQHLIEKPEIETHIIEETSASSITKPRMFISHGKNLAIVDQVKTMLDLNNLEYEIAVEEETPAIPVSEKVFEAMHRCNAALITVTVDESEKRADGRYGINQNVLIEIGAAFVLYKKRVILVWDNRIDVPSNLQGLYRCEFTGNEFSWADGMKLMKAISNFRKG